jgi:N-acetylglucosaminyldiphosphoundecaprenol N-acetyl-beta-D-mannosaminyltransferase
MVEQGSMRKEHMPANSLDQKIPQTATVFTVPIEGGSLKQILDFIFKSSPDSKNSAAWIVTANPEILLQARTKPDYASALKQADYRSVDGFGLQALLRIIGFDVARVTGVALSEALIHEAANRNWKVGFIGGDPGVASQVANYWQTQEPRLQVVHEEGGLIGPDGQGDAVEEEAVHRLVLEAPDVLLVAFGGGTKQEQWILRRLPGLPSVKAIVGVGGAFDFWTGRIRRAPTFMQKIGLEWLWRLLQQPKRIGRIIRATIVFPIFFLLDAFKQGGEQRKKALYFLTIVLRIIFISLVLVPAVHRYGRFVLSQGITRYPWAISDLVVPLVIFVVSYPIVLFMYRLKYPKNQ